MIAFREQLYHLHSALTNIRIRFEVEILAAASHRNLSLTLKLAFDTPGVKWAHFHISWDHRHLDLIASLWAPPWLDLCSSVFQELCLLGPAGILLSPFIVELTSVLVDLCLAMIGDLCLELLRLDILFPFWLLRLLEILFRFLMRESLDRLNRNFGRMMPFASLERLIAFP